MKDLDCVTDAEFVFCIPGKGNRTGSPARAQVLNALCCKRASEKVCLLVVG